MKILITGAGGFLGKAVLERLIAHGETDIRCLYRARGPQHDIQLPAGSTFEAVNGNLRSPKEAKRALAGVSTVYHLAAGLKGGAADIFLDTVVASRCLLDAAVSAGVHRLVLVSSFGVYGVSRINTGAVIDENSPLEPHPEQRDPYSHAKLRQEQLFREYQARHGFELVILRPGVIYGPGGSPFSTRIGLSLPGFLLHVGGRNQLPITHVLNCAEAIAIAGRHPDAGGQIYNVLDDELIRAKDYLRRYRGAVGPVRSIRLPLAGAKLLARMIVWYSRYSHGQMPAFLTPYKADAMWKSTRFSNEKLRGIGWRPIFATEEGLDGTFRWFREQTVK